MEEVTLFIDGKQLTVQKGTTVLEAALKNNIYIPHLCFHPELKPVGACRLCFVEIEGKGTVLACRVPAGQGMAVKTKTPEIDELRRGIVELLVAEHHEDCRNCPKAGRCELQKIINHLRIDRKKAAGRLRLAAEESPPDTSNPFFDFNPNKCVLCGRCVRTCTELLSIGAIDIAGRGHQSRVASLGGKLIAQSNCESCGECVERCPVGALVYKEYRRPKEQVATVCPYCSAGCQVTFGLRDSRISSAQGSPLHPLCARGRFGWRYVYAPERLTSPLIRQNGQFREASWAEAVKLVAEKFSRYRGGQFAVIAPARCTNEEAYLIQKFARGVMGTNNIENTSSLTLGTSLRALGETTGAVGATNTFAQIEDAVGILLAGANITRTHPVVAWRIKRAVQKGSRLIVIDPVENDLFRFAHLWLKPYPGTDLALLMGMAGVIAEENLLAESFLENKCTNFPEFKESLEDFSRGRVERITGVPRELIEEAARVFATARPASILWSGGISQYYSGKDTVHALVNLALLTGNVGLPAAGLYPLGEQNNAQGVCDMGCLPDFYPGYQPVTDDEARGKFAAAWGLNLNPAAGLTLTELWKAVREEKVKCLYIIGANPAKDAADTQKVRACLEKVEFLVFQDLFANETADYADVILPAVSFAEKEGTFTSGDRRVQKVRQVIAPTSQALPDGQIINQLAQEMGAGGFAFHPAEIRKEIDSLTPIYQGISTADLEKSAFVWPAGNPALYSDRFFTSTGKAKFTPLEYQGPREHPDVEYPLIFTTRRNSLFFGTCAHQVEGFRLLTPDEYLEINPKDAGDWGISEGERVKVVSRRGELEALVKITEEPLPGVVVLNINSPQNPVHLLTQEESKICAVRLEK